MVSQHLAFWLVRFAGYDAVPLPVGATCSLITSQTPWYSWRVTMSGVNMSGVCRYVSKYASTQVHAGMQAGAVRPVNGMFGIGLPSILGLR